MKKDISMHVMMPPKDFVGEAIRIVERAESRNISLRIIGALGVYISIMDKDEYLRLYEILGRFIEGELRFTDLDLVGYRKQRNAIERFFRELSYKPNEYVNALFSDRRLIYSHPEQLYTIDIFFSPLEFSHVIDLGKDPESGRLRLAYPTLPLSDMVLLKLQIHDINRKDLADLAVLLSSHQLSESEESGKINVSRITEVLSEDWGFWYDAVNNLKLLKQFLSEFMDRGETMSYRGTIKETLQKIEEIEHRLNESPKSKKWIERSKIGTKKRWYNVVEEL
jgi:hypothetical protein